MRISWLSFLVGVQAVVALGQSPQWNRSLRRMACCRTSMAITSRPLAPGVFDADSREWLLGPRNSVHRCHRVREIGKSQVHYCQTPIWANGLTYPTALCGVQVTVRGIQAGLMAVQERQIIFQSPAQNAD